MFLSHVPSPSKKATSIRGLISGRTDFASSCSELPNPKVDWTFFNAEPSLHHSLILSNATKLGMRHVYIILSRVIFIPRHHKPLVSRPKVLKLQPLLQSQGFLHSAPCRKLSFCLLELWAKTSWVQQAPLIAKDHTNYSSICFLFVLLSFLIFPLALSCSCLSCPRILCKDEKQWIQVLQMGTLRWWNHVEIILKIDDNRHPWENPPKSPAISPLNTVRLSAALVSSVTVTARSCRSARPWGIWVPRWTWGFTRDASVLIQMHSKYVCKFGGCALMVRDTVPRCRCSENIKKIRWISKSYFQAFQKNLKSIEIVLPKTCREGATTRLPSQTEKCLKISCFWFLVIEGIKKACQAKHFEKASNSETEQLVTRCDRQCGIGIICITSLPTCLVRAYESPQTSVWERRVNNAAERGLRRKRWSNHREDQPRTTVSLRWNWNPRSACHSRNCPWHNRKLTTSSKIPRGNAQEMNNFKIIAWLTACFLHVFWQKWFFVPMTWLNGNVVNCGPKTSKNCTAWTTAYCHLPSSSEKRRTARLWNRSLRGPADHAEALPHSILLEASSTYADCCNSCLVGVIFSAFCMLGLRSACGARNLQCLPCHCASSPAKWGAHHRYGLCGTTAGASGSWKRGWSSKTLKGRSHEKYFDRWLHLPQTRVIEFDCDLVKKCNYTKNRVWSDALVFIW